MTKNNGKYLYYIAWVIEGPAALELRHLQEYACEKFNSCKALRSPPHVTIIPPFHRERENEKKLFETVMKWSAKLPRFEWEIDGFNRFENRVIYADVKGPDELTRYRNQLMEMLEIPNKFTKYTPHITIAYRDLTPEVFGRIWEHFSSLALKHVAIQTEVSILRHNGEKWNVIRRFSMNDHEIVKE